MVNENIVVPAPESTSPPTGPLPLSGYARASVDRGFEQRLIDSTRPIVEHFLAAALHHFFDTGVFNELTHQSPHSAPIPSIAGTLDMDEHRLRGLLLFLANEGVVTVEDDVVTLTAKGRQYGEFRAWYTLMIGGYALTVQRIGETLSRGSRLSRGEGRYVASGSCEMSRFDGMPMVRTLLAESGVNCHEMLDLGCGNALYLVEFCREMPGTHAWGAEPDRGGYEEGLQLVDRAGMSDRIRLRNKSATEFLRDPPADCNPDLIVFGYVLQEILAQEGDEAVVELLRAVVDCFPQINVIVLEVANEIDNPAIMRHGLARNFWNAYYLIHYFTPQRLEKQVFWERIFKAAGLHVVDLITTDPAVDSTRLELGYLLRGTAA